MSITINTNLASLMTQRRLENSSAALGRSFERLSSGLRINRAADDAAGLAIADSLNADRRVFNQGIRNLNDGLSLLNVADGAVAELSNIVIRIRELSEQSANGTLSNQQRQALDEEAQALSDEYTRIIQSTEANNQNLLDGSIGELTLQAGYGLEGTLSTLIGSRTIGTGSFFDVTTFSTEVTASRSLELSDLDGDGNLDLVTAGTDAGAGVATVQFGNGDGTFSNATTYATEAGFSMAIALEDINADGIMDLVTAGDAGGTGYATIRLGNGDGTFAGAISYATEAFRSNAVSLADIDNDGNIDLITAGDDGADGRFTVRLGNGNGTFGGATSYLTETDFSYGVALSDFDGDGNLDIVTVGQGGPSQSNGRAKVRLGNGDGTFGAFTTYFPEASDTYGVAIADVNGDGIDDFVTGGRTGPNRSFSTVFLGDGDGTFTELVSYETEPKITFSVTLEDLNADGALDLITIEQTLNDAGAMSIRLGNGDGTFGALTTYDTDSTVSNPSRGIVAGDVNSDGVPDLLTANVSGTASVFLAQTEETGGFSPLAAFSLATREGALSAMTALDSTIEDLAIERGSLGAFYSRVETAINNLQSTATNIRAAESQIRDVDVAREAAELARLSILQQAGAAILGQANIQPQIALGLLST